MVRVFPNKIKVGDRFKTKSNVIVYTCISTKIYIQVQVVWGPRGKWWVNPRVLKKKISRESILVREILLEDSNGHIYKIADVNPAGKPKWINEQRFNIIDAKGKLRVGYHISFTKIDD